MADEVNPSSVETQAGATLLLAGFVTSALFLVAASILWIGFLIAAALGGSGDRRMSGGEFMSGFITIINAALFYIWGIYGLGKSRKVLKAALARKESAVDRTGPEGAGRP